MDPSPLITILLQALVSPPDIPTQPAISRLFTFGNRPIPRPDPALTPPNLVVEEYFQLVSGRSFVPFRLVS
jgi:hypothetical protein